MMQLKSLECHSTPPIRVTVPAGYPSKAPHSAQVTEVDWTRMAVRACRSWGGLWGWSIYPTID